MTIGLSFQFNYFNNYYTSVSIESNGYIGFGLTSFPIIVQPNTNIISAYNSDLATSTCGTLWYRDTVDPTDLSQIASDVNTYYKPAVVFSPTNAFVVTWDSICQLSNANAWSTFQVIITTDGIQHYLIVNYGSLGFSLTSASYFQYTDLNSNFIKKLFTDPPISYSNVNNAGKWIYATYDGKLVLFIFLFIFKGSIYTLFLYLKKIKKKSHLKN